MIPAEFIHHVKMAPPMKYMEFVFGLSPKLQLTPMFVCIIPAGYLSILLRALDILSRLLKSMCSWFLSRKQC